MHSYQLREIVEAARNLTSAGNDDKKSFDCLKYRVDCTGEVNWDSFKFEYVTDEPLNQVKLDLITIIMNYYVEEDTTIVCKPIMAMLTQVFGPCFNHYADVFQFLWRLKKVYWTANKMWHGLTCFIKKTHNMFGKSRVYTLQKRGINY